MDACGILSGPHLTPDPRREASDELREFSVVAFASKGQRKLELLSVPFSRLSMPPASLLASGRLSSLAAGSLASVGRWQPRFRPKEGLTASLSEVWEEALGLPSAHGRVLQKRTCCS